MGVRENFSQARVVRQINFQTEGCILKEYQETSAAVIYKENYKMKNITTLGALSLAFLLAGTGLVHAGDSKNIKEISPAAAPAVSDWAVELGTGIEYSNVRTSGLEGSTHVPLKLSAILKIDDVSNDQFLGGIFRGYTDFLFTGYGRFISGAPEHHIFGIQSGPRYSFVQPGWKLVPYVESEVGLGFADSNGRYPVGGPKSSGLGEDFNFTFTVGTGVKYDFTPQVYGKLAVKYTHYSNAGLSEPNKQNEPVDSFGPEVAVGYRF
jgi:opacity protein-like surface antigen